MKEDVKKKSFSPPLEKTRVWMTYIQPHLILGGVIGLVALAALSPDLDHSAPGSPLRRKRTIREYKVKTTAH